MSQLLLHADTRAELEHYVARPSHAVMFAGPEGAGKATIALSAIATLLGIEVSSLGTYPYYLHVRPVNNIHSIETIRGLHEFLRLRTTGEGAIRRAVVIEDAHTLTIEAQNAFLKILEEPPTDTVIVLTATGENSLLPTIYSRVQKITVKPASKSDLLAYFANTYPAPAVEKAYYISDGQVGLMSALLAEDTQHPLVASITAAKAILGASTFDRLCQVDSLSKQKESIPSLLYALERIGHAGLVRAAETDRQVDVVRWHGVLKKLSWCQKQLERNAQTKLLLTDLMLSL